MFFFRNSIISLFLLILTLPVALANDCVVDYKTFESFIDGLSKDLKVILPEKLHKPNKDSDEVKGGYIEHHVKLKDGTVIRFERGGCKRYGYQMRFENIRNLLEIGGGDINKIMEKVDAVVANVPFKDKKAFSKDWNKVKKYVENKITSQNYKFDDKEGYVVAGVNIEKDCPDGGKSICGVVLGFDVFEIYNSYSP